MSEKVPQDIDALQVSDDELRTTPRPVIVNVVATYDLTNPTINTEMLTMRLPGLGFHPQRFAAAKMRLSRAMTLTFCGGRAVCPGSRSVQGARQAALRFAEVQLRSGEYVQYRRFRLQNIVMSVWADFEVELRAIQEQYSARTDYCDSRFPGLSFRIGSGKRRIVCNIFVTGRVVITGSRDEDHSYKVRARARVVVDDSGSLTNSRCTQAWWWLYTHVLKRFRRTAAPGTSSSADYRMETHRRLNTLASDCGAIASRYTRRLEGPMARSSTYGEFVSTPRYTAGTPMHVPMTPRSVVSTPRANGSDAAAAVVVVEQPLEGVALYFDRMNRYFGGHSATCPYVVTARDTAERTWFDEWRELGYVDDERVGELLEAHVRAGCVSQSVFHRVEHCRTLLARYRNQLALAIGRATMSLLDEPNGRLVGHTPACPFMVGERSRERWNRMRERLEVAMAGGVDSPEYDAHTLVGAHHHAGCQLVGEPENDAEALRQLIVQLHHVADDFEDDDECDVDEDYGMVEVEALTMDDMQDYEALYRLERIRERPDEWPDVAFELPSSSSSW